VPVILLSGTVPMFRSIDATTPAALDVVQLQTHFLEMGFTDSYPVTRSMHDLNEDRYVTDVKDAEIKDWQESVGVEPTGRVNKGQIVFRPEPIRVDAVTAQLGQVVNGGSLIDVSGVSRVVTAQLGTDLNGLITVNDIVQVELPDGKLVEGKTTYVADTVTRLVQGQQETTYLEVVIELVGSGTSFDQSPVTVKVEEILERGANAVPISSLLALAEGGYAVEVFESNGTVKLLGVELGTFHGNQVSISRGLKPGQSVIVP
jgi:multidrug efflux system membrane fusion protein